MILVWAFYVEPEPTGYQRITAVLAEDTHVTGKECHGETLAHPSHPLRAPSARADTALSAG